MAPAAIVVNESNATLDRNPIKHESAATRLRNNLETGAGLIVCPGVYDGLSARIALDVGFDALYMVCPSRSPANCDFHATSFNDD
jgi:2-methylisocitrate lyase-like PEP mutase family enzyme